MSKKFRGQCLIPKALINKRKIGEGTLLGISSECNHSWLFTKDKQLRFGASNFVLHYAESLNDRNNVMLWPNTLETKESKWTVVEQNDA